MASNKSKEISSSFEDMTFLYKLFLRIIGILPFWHNNLANQLTVAYWLIIITIYWSMYAVYALTRGEVPEIDAICETVVTIGVGVRYYLLLVRRSEFAELLEECRAIWEEFDETGHRTVRYFEEKIRLLFKILFASSNFTAISYAASTALSTVRAAHLNNTHDQYLPNKWYTEGTVTKDVWPSYEIVFTVQVIANHSACVVLSIIDSAAPLLIMIGAGYFRALHHRLLLIVDDDDFELMFFIKLHQRILNFCSRIERITRTLFFVQLLCSVYTLSLVGIKIISSDPDKYKYLPFVLLILSQLFICQWAPDHLIDESTAISTAAYSVSFGWMRRRIGILFVLMIARSQRPVQMTAAGIVNLSLDNFASMLTSAVSFFTMLRNVNL